VKPKQVAISIVVIFVCIIGFDIWLYSDEVPGNSISQVIIDASTVSPLVPWFIGLLMGFTSAHFFDTYSEPRNKRKKDESKTDNNRT
jgi:hypothetical protein